MNSKTYFFRNPSEKPHHELQALRRFLGRPHVRHGRRQPRPGPRGERRCR